MHESLDKIKFLDLIRTEYGFVKRTLALIDKQQMEQPGVTPAGWSVKDVVAHLAAWQSLCYGWIATSQRGEIPEAPAPGYEWDQIDQLNEQMYQDNMDRPLDEVLSDFDASHQQLVGLIEAFSENDLFDPGLYEWTSDELLIWTIIAHNTYLHYPDHVKRIRAWLAQQLV